MKKVFFILWTLFFYSCTHTKSHSVFEVVGSDTMLELSQSLAEEFYEQKNIAVNVSGGGSGVGINSLIQGDIFLANASRKLKSTEIEFAQKKHINLCTIPIANDYLSIVTNKSNSVKSLTLQQLSDIYTGKIKNWKEVGGDDLPISLYGRQSSSGTYDFFQKQVLHKQDYTAHIKEMTGNPQLLEAIKHDKGAISYVGIGYSLTQKNLINILELEGMNPEQESSSYPLKRELYTVTTDLKNKNIQQWLSFIFSKTGSSIIKKVGYSPLSNEDISSIKKRFSIL